MDLELTKGNHNLKQLVLQTVERYVSYGLQIVVVHSAWCDNPIKKGKAPTHFGWQKDALTLDQLKKEIERVWSREGGVNIGLKTGRASGLVCIDVDAKSGGLAWYHENEMHLGNPIKEHTAQGGLHLYYRYPSAVTGCIRSASSGRRLFKGVDILADGAGQVVTYPSIHANGETQYVFERGLDLVDALEEADELPKWIVDEMLEKDRQSAAHSSQQSSSSEASELDLLAAKLALQDFPAAVEGQGGDMQTLRAAMLCRDYGLNESQVFQLLATEYNGRCSPPWDMNGLRDKVKNAFRYGRMSQGIQSVEQAFEEPPSEPQPVNADERYSKKNAIHCARVFMRRKGELIGCYDSQFVVYDTDHHRWMIVSDSYMDSIIYRDIHASCDGGELIRTMKVGHISDIRKAVKFHLNTGMTIPDVHWKGRDGKNYVTLNNGILDVETGELLRHTQDWFCFQSVSVNYDEKAQCPEFLKFLQDVWDGDAELIESLRLWMGYCLLAESNLQKFAVFKGASRAGKSTLVGVIEAMLGADNCASTSLSLIGSDFGLESLIGKKLCVFQDADRASADRMGVATERIKSLASNDPMGINRKGQSVVNQKLGTKVAFVCNKMPPFLNDENSLTNRMIVFPFWKSFQGREDFNLLERLEGEIQGVLNWALVGARRILRGERLVMSQRGQDALEEITQQLDSVQGFIAECVENTAAEHNRVGSRALWEAYREWCKESGRMAKNRQKFFREIGAHRLFSDRTWRDRTERGYWGIRLIVDTFDEPSASLVHEDDQGDIPF